MEPIPGVLLGAGGSARFGSEKLFALLPTGERLLERALRVHLQSHISPLVLVVSPNLRKTITGNTDTFSFSGLAVGKRLTIGFPSPADGEGGDWLLMKTSRKECPLPFTRV